MTALESARKTFDDNKVVRMTFDQLINIGKQIQAKDPVTYDMFYHKMKEAGTFFNDVELVAVAQAMGIC